MSKEKPEVGDVWGHKTNKTLLHIIEVGGNFITFLGCNDDVYPHKTYKRYYVNSFSEFDNDPRYTYFTEDYEFKGKSKVSIKELFEVKEQTNGQSQIALDLW